MADRYANLPGPAAEDPLDQKSAPNRSDRLESWKEIASYLKRDLRTVQRWEKREGLPIHRHQHDERATVFAYKAELDAWWHNGHSQLEEEGGEEGKQTPETATPDATPDHGNGRSHGESSEPETQPQPHFGPRRRRLWVAGAAVAAAALAAVAIYFLRPRPSPSLHFQSHDVVLIASFQNRTGDPLFDGTMEAALGRELANSQFVSVAPRVRINDTLALMRKPANTRVDAALGREICLRDGGIQALITGSIEKFGSTYALSAELLDPASGRTVASFEQDAGNQNGVLAAVHRISNELRHSLGEKLSQIHRSDLALQKVTTPSLRALQLYSRADDELDEDKCAAASELFTQAIAEDPNFASAYIMAAESLECNETALPREYMPYAKRAMELSSRASERERLYIEGDYYRMSGRWRRAVAAFEALLQIDPTNLSAALFLSGLVGGQPIRPMQVILPYVRIAKLRPNSFVANCFAGYGFTIVEEDPGRAGPYLERASALLRSPASDTKTEGLGAWLRLYPAFETWMKDDLEDVRSELARDERNASDQDSLSTPQDFGFFSLALGQTRNADVWFQSVSNSAPLQRDSDMAVVAYLRGNHATLREQLRKIARLDEAGATPVSLMIREGLLREAHAVVRTYLKSQSPAEARPPIKLLAGELLVAEGNETEGMPLLREGVQWMRISALPDYFLGAESLAKAYEKEGKLPAALQVLEDAAANRRRVNYVITMAGAPFWMQDEIDLAQLYRRMGRVRDAEKIETELRKLLAYADPDFSLLVELKKLQDTPSMASKSN